MRDGGTVPDAGDDGSPQVALRGRIRGRVRGITTVDGWELAALHVGGVLATCTGTGAADILSALQAGDEVVVRGRLRPRRGGRPEGDSVELEAALVAVRRPPGTHPMAPRPRRPRIAS
ncbi:hypothetical protein [Clavibacter sp. CT19]|uniref:hypothetical protein n=1 Tax=unclassified Clavibacter TaxID=2626594 RepID=UPI0022EB24B9|nr:hypothetical protein [Clavibacter sp. CT19]